MGVPLKEWPGPNREGQSHVPQESPMSCEERTISDNTWAHETAVLHRRVTNENITALYKSIPSLPSRTVRKKKAISG
jgi:hypothetical protein